MMRCRLASGTKAEDGLSDETQVGEEESDTDQPVVHEERHLGAACCRQRLKASA